MGHVTGWRKPFLIVIFALLFCATVLRLGCNDASWSQGACLASCKQAKADQSQNRSASFHFGYLDRAEASQGCNQLPAYPPQRLLAAAAGPEPAGHNVQGKASHGTVQLVLYLSTIYQEVGQVLCPLWWADRCSIHSECCPSPVERACLVFGARLGATRVMEPTAQEKIAAPQRSQRKREGQERSQGQWKGRRQGQGGRQAADTCARCFCPAATSSSAVLGPAQSGTERMGGPIGGAKPVGCTRGCPEDIRRYSASGCYGPFGGTGARGCESRCQADAQSCECPAERQEGDHPHSGSETVFPGLMGVLHQHVSRHARQAAGRARSSAEGVQRARTKVGPATCRGDRSSDKVVRRSAQSRFRLRDGQGRSGLHCCRPMGRRDGAVATATTTAISAACSEQGPHCSREVCTRQCSRHLSHSEEDEDDGHLVIPIKDGPN